jgi:hypothetical protein
LRVAFWVSGAIAVLMEVVSALGLLVDGPYRAFLWSRRTPQGYVFGTAMAVMGAVYQLNLWIAGVFRASANVRGVKAFPVEGVVLATCFGLAALALLLDRQR